MADAKVGVMHKVAAMEIIGERAEYAQELQRVAEILAAMTEGAALAEREACCAILANAQPNTRAEKAIERIHARADELPQWLAGEISEWLTAMGAITVSAYRRATVPKGDLASWAKRAAIHGIDSFVDSYKESEYGDPEGDHEPFSDEQLAGAQEKIETVLREMGAAGTSWHCEKVAEREYSEDEVIALMREENPQWFEDKTPA